MVIALPAFFAVGPMSREASEELRGACVDTLAKLESLFAESLKEEGLFGKVGEGTRFSDRFDCGRGLAPGENTQDRIAVENGRHGTWPCDRVPYLYFVVTT